MTTVHPMPSPVVSIEVPLAAVLTETAAHLLRHANEAFCSMVAVAKPSVMDRPLLDVLGVADHDALRALLNRVLVTGAPDVRSDLRWHAPGAPDGLRYLTVLASPIAREPCASRGLLVQLLDTTEQALARAVAERAAHDVQLANEALVLAGLRDHELAEAAVRERARRDALVQNMAEGVAILEGNGQPPAVNPVGRALLGLASGGGQDYLAHTFYAVNGAALPPHEHPGHRALSGESFVEEEVLHRRADGSVRRLLISGGSVRDETGRVDLAINVFRDVTALRQLEEMREEYVALLSHDLRNPLHALLINSQLLTEALAPGAPESVAQQRKYAQAIERVTRRLAVMVDELYESSQAEAGRLALHLQPISPVSLVGGVIDSIGAPSERKRIVLRESACSVPRVCVDVPKMERVLVNLLTNALKYSTPDSEVLIDLEGQGSEVVFSVRDHGPGMSAEELPHIFDKYRRGHHTANREGLGLGLYISRRIIEAHGGRVWVESTPSEGSVFRVAVPAAEVVSGKAGSKRHGRSPPEHSRSR